MKPILLLILGACAALPPRLNAEPTSRYLEVRCDPARQQVTAQLRFLNEKPPDEKWYGTLRSAGNQTRFYRLTSNVDYGECTMARGKPVRGDKGRVHAFPLHHMRVAPFTWEGRTHFLVEAGSPLMRAVLMPSAGASPWEVCVLREIPG